MTEGVDYKIDIRIWNDTMYVARCLSCDYRTGRYGATCQGNWKIGQP